MRCRVGVVSLACKADARLSPPPQSEELELAVDVDKPSTKTAKATEAERRAVAAAAKGLHAQLLKVLQTLDAEMLARLTQSS